MSDRNGIAMKSLQRADHALGAVVCTLLQPLRWLRFLRSRPRAARKVLSIKFWGIGSLQLLTPAIAGLRKRHAEAEIVFLTLSGNRDAAERLGVFDRVITLDVGGASWFAVFVRIARVALELRREKFDVVYDFEFFTRFSAIVSVLTGAPRTYGFAAPRIWRGRFHTDVVPFNRYWHVARNFRVLAGGENGRNVTADDLAPHEFGERELARVDALLLERGVAIDAGFAVLNPNAGQLSLERRWPVDNFRRLARRFAHDAKLPVILIGAASEREYTELVAKDCDADVIDLAGALTTAELVALLSRTSIFVTNDSGPMHLAAAIGAPTVGLFGPETPVMYGPIGLRAVALYRPPPCSPCINVHNNKVASCIYGEPQCLVNLSVDEVFATACSVMRGDDFVIAPAPRRVASESAESNAPAKRL